MLKDSLGSKLKDAKSIISDSASAYQDFCNEYKFELNAIPYWIERFRLRLIFSEVSTFLIRELTSFCCYIQFND